MKPTPSRKASGARVLYLSYDGMCDPLGSSQVLPYLFGLARRGHRITLISFEKAERTAEDRARVQQACDDAGIRWHPLRYHKRPPILSGMYDVWQMQKLARRLHHEQQFDLIHCRSYLPALVGLRLKRRLGLGFVFDMRGFWADERIDGGIWKLSNPAHRAVFDFFKRREADFLTEADQVVSLTEEGRKVLLARRADPTIGPPITIIPCCVDFSAFPPVSAEARGTSREQLGIPPKATVAVYLGSFGSWYMVDAMLDFFRVQLRRDPAAVFLVISREPPQEIHAAARARGIPQESVVVRGASRVEVPRFVAAADYGLFFIKPVFSKKASSPTKMGEFLALEIPMVTNGNVGDVAQIMDEAHAGVVVKDFDEAAYEDALERLEQFHPDKERWRAAAHRWFDLDVGIDRYDTIYCDVKAGQHA